MKQIQANATIQKAAVQNSLILAYALSQFLPESKLKADLETFQRQEITKLPPRTQQWVSREMSSEKTIALADVLKDHFSVYSGVHAEVYSKVYRVLNGLSRLDLRDLSVEKYKALLSFIIDEIEAEVRGTTTCVDFSNGSLTFKLMQHGTK